MKGLHVIAFILIIVGALNWGLVGINPNWNVVAMLGDAVSQVVYILVGIAAIFELLTHKRGCSSCCAGGNKVEM